MTEKELIKMLIEDLEETVCPRCGKHTMETPKENNALSRHIDAYICSDCGTKEALIDYLKKEDNVATLTDWFILKENNKSIDKLLEQIENQDWSITKSSYGYTLSKMINGYDFNIEIEGNTVDELVKSIWQNYDNYDVSYETYLWLDNTGHGKNGSPYDMKDIYDTMSECEQNILELYESIDLNKI